MTMHVTLEDFLGVDTLPAPEPDVIASKMAIDFEANAFLRMKELGLKQKDLAQMMGVSPAAVSKMLSTAPNLTFMTVARVAAALGCDATPPQLVPLEARSRNDDTAALPSGATATMMISDDVLLSRKRRRSPADSVDDEYRELCANRARFESSTQGINRAQRVFVRSISQYEETA